MIRVKALVSSLAVPFLAASILTAQAPEKPKPGPEHQALARFAGQWKGSGTMKESPFGPGGPMTWTEQCNWFEGGFSLVCESKGTGPMGSMKGLSILGFNADEKTYTFYGIDNAGWAGRATGTKQGEMWTYQNEEKMGGQSFKTRYVIKETSPTAHTFKWEISTDGSSWTTVMEGQATKAQ